MTDGGADALALEASLTVRTELARLKSSRLIDHWAVVGHIPRPARRRSSVVEQENHNLLVGGSNPSAATKSGNKYKVLAKQGSAKSEILSFGNFEFINLPDPTPRPLAHSRLTQGALVCLAAI